MTGERLKDGLSVGGNVGSLIQATPLAWGAVVGGGTLVASFAKTASLSIAALIIGSSLISFGCGVLIARRVRLRTTTLERPVSDNNPALRITKDHRIAYIKSRSEIEYEYRFTLLAKDTVEVFRQTVRWSGLGSLEVRVLTPGVHMISYPGGLIMQLFGFVLPRRLKKGESFELAYRIVTNATLKEAEPFLSVGSPAADRGDDNLLEVRFKDRVSVKHVYEQWFKRGEDWPSASKALTLDEDRSARISYPHEGGSRRAIIWEYGDDMGND